MDGGDVDCCPSCYSPADDAECDCHHSHHHHPFASAAAAAANALLNSNQQQQHQHYTATTPSPQPPSTPEALHQLMGASSASASSSSLDADFAAATCEGGVGMTHNDHIDHTGTGTGTGGVIFGIGIGVGCCDVDSNWDARSDAGSTRSSRGSTSREESENRLQQIKVIIKAPNLPPLGHIPFFLSFFIIILKNCHSTTHSRERDGMGRWRREYQKKTKMVTKIAAPQGKGRDGEGEEKVERVNNKSKN